MNSNIVRTSCGASLTHTAITLPPALLFQEYERLVAETIVYEQSSQWWIGDLLLQGEQRFGDSELYLQAFPEGRAIHTYENYRWVCRKFPPERRRPAPLTLSHHAEVASLDPAEADALLDEAMRDGWSVAKLRQIRRERLEQREPAPTLSIPSAPHPADAIAEMSTIIDKTHWAEHSTEETIAGVELMLMDYTETPAKQHLNALLRAMERWAADAGGIPDHAQPAYFAACAFVCKGEN